MGIRRSALAFEDNYTQIPNEWARDPRLSRRARGLLVEIMSHRVGWHVTIRSLARAGKEGRDAIQTALNELLEHGYIRRAQGRAEAGKFGEIEYELCEPAASGFSVHGSAASGSAVSGESDHKEEHPSEDQWSEDDLSLLPAPQEISRAEAFEQFYAAYPRRVGRAKAELKFFEALRKGVHARVIIDGARRYASDPNLPRDRQYIPHPATWLHGGRWDDEPEVPHGHQSFAQQKQENNLALVARYQEEESRAQVGSREAADVRAIAARA